MLFITVALGGVVPKVGPGLDPKFESEQGRKQIIESRPKEDIRNSIQSELPRKNSCCPFEDKM